MAVLPDRLHQVLNAIGDLATDIGRRNLLAALHPHGEQALSEVQSTSELALLMFLDHRAAFDVAYGRASSRGTRRYAIFAGSQGPTATSSSTELQARLTNAVTSWLNLLEGHPRLDIRVDDASGQLSLLVLYQREAPVTGMMMRGWASRLPPLPELNALVTYHARCGLLCVRAESMSEQHAYRRIFGRALFGDESWFQTKEIFTMDPLIEHGIEALSADGIRGLQSTLLRSVEVVGPDRSHATMELSADDLSGTLSTPMVQSALARGIGSSMGLAFNLSGFPRPLFAKIAPPNGLTLTGPFAQKDIARDFLVARGFMRLSAAA
jgi:hypothetical protein